MTFVLACCVLAVVSPATAQLPPGFQETVLVDGVSVTALDWAPNGDVWFVERPDRIWIHRQGDLILAATLPVSTIGEHGIAGLAIDTTSGRCTV